MRIVTVGHSTRTLEAFLHLLQSHGVQHLVDVRRFPASRRHPHFSREPLAMALAGGGMTYHWMEDLGGRRQRRPNSRHLAWRIGAFAAYADHMESTAFQNSAQRVLLLGESATTAIMCAEARPEQCHRRLISDWLLLHGATVEHLRSPRRTTPHQLPEFARIEGRALVYDGGQLDLL